MQNNEQSSVIEVRIARAKGFYPRLRDRASEWLGKHSVTGPLREYLLLLPDLFALLVRLIRDPRVDRSLKAQLLAVAAYVISPVDLIPDLFMPLGLADDTVAVAFMISRVVKIMGEAGESVLREHWEGEGDLLRQVEHVIDVADGVLSNRVVKRLQRRFGRGKAAA